MSVNPSSTELPNDPRSPARANDQFETTHWSLVLAAGERNAPGSKEALSSLCARYWYPLYAYIRRRIRDSHEAQDLVQEFFSQLLEKNVLAVASPDRGHFRAFLLTSLRNFLSNERDRSQAKKRGGTNRPLSLDFAAGESRFVHELADRMTPDQLFDRQWAETLLTLVLARLKDEHVRSGKQKHYEILKPFLSGRNPGSSYRAAAERLRMSEGAVAVAAHRLRRRYRELLRAEIAQTVVDPSEIDDEIRRLFVSLGG